MNQLITRLIQFIQCEHDVEEGLKQTQYEYF